MNLCTKSLLLLVVAIAQTYGAIYDHVSQLPTHEYDYIIVGGTLPAPYHEPNPRTHPRTSLGGTAGNVVANRLTEDNNVQVLVLEAGGRLVACRPLITRDHHTHRLQQRRNHCIHNPTLMPHPVPRHCKFDQPKKCFSRLRVKKPYDWNYTTTSQPGLNGRSFPYGRGKVLGGSSSISEPSPCIAVTLLTPLNPLRLHGVQYGLQRRLGSHQQNHWGP